MPISQKIFESKINEFKTVEDRAPFFDISRKLVVENKKIEGAIMLLSTWNFAYFRYVITNLDINKLKAIIDYMESKIIKLSLDSINKENLGSRRKELEQLFDYVSSEPITSQINKKHNKIGPTGASKLLCLFKPDFFIIWDHYIRGEEKKEKYNKYKDIKTSYKEIFKNRKYPTYKKSGQGYLEFLKDMKDLFFNYNTLKNNTSRTWAKIIDEFNYVCISNEFFK